MTQRKPVVGWVGQAVDLSGRWIRWIHWTYSSLDLTPEPLALSQLDSNTPDGSEQMPSPAPCPLFAPSLVHRAHFHLDETDGNHVFGSTRGFKTIQPLWLGYQLWSCVWPVHFLNSDYVHKKYEERKKRSRELISWRIVTNKYIFTTGFGIFYSPGSRLDGLDAISAFVVESNL